MSLINISNLSFHYEGSYDNIFENVSFQIDTNWKLGFVGRNGRGKTTFLHLLLGKYAYAGTIGASVAFDYFPFEVRDKSRLTREVVDGVVGEYALWELERELSLLQVPEEVLERPFDTLSGGEQVKVLLAALFLKQNNFLLIDEPTNHLDADARRVVGAYLRAKRGFILVSHDRVFLDSCIDHVLSINRANIELQKGNFSSWQRNRQLQDAFEAAEHEKLTRKASQLAAATQRTAGWSDRLEKTKNGTRNSGLRPDRGYIGHKSAKLMKRAKSLQSRREEALEQTRQLLKNAETAEALSLSPLVYHAGQLVSAEGLSIAYGGREVCGGLRFAVCRGDRVALTGKNGCGKTSLLRLIAGEEVPHSGTLRLGSGLVISYLPQDTSFLRGGLKDYAAREGIDESLFKAILRKLDFERVQFDKQMESFSEGQKKKVLLAKSLCERAHLYIWDEPLNFIDVLSRMQIEQLLLDSKPTMLFVEHDRSFYENVATKVIAL